MDKLQKERYLMMYAWDTGNKTWEQYQREWNWQGISHKEQGEWWCLKGRHKASMKNGSQI